VRSVLDLDSEQIRMLFLAQYARAAECVDQWRRRETPRPLHSVVLGNCVAADSRLKLQYAGRNPVDSQAWSDPLRLPRRWQRQPGRGLGGVSVAPDRQSCEKHTEQCF